MFFLSSVLNYELQVIIRYTDNGWPDIKNGSNIILTDFGPMIIILRRSVHCLSDELMFSMSIVHFLRGGPLKLDTDRGVQCCKPLKVFK